MTTVFIGLAGTLLSGLWIGVCLALAGVGTLYLVGGGSSALPSLVIASWNTLFNFSLTGLPLFLFLGEIFVASGLARRSYDAISPLFERFPGKLLISNVVLDTMMGAVVGTSMATAAVVGSIAYPELTKRGYDKRTVIGNLAGAGCLGSFVPPSIGMVVYAAWVEISVAATFAALVIPALIYASLSILYVAIISARNPRLTGLAAQPMPLSKALGRTRGVWPMLLLMGSILGAILLGIATPTEAAGLGTGIALVMSVAFGALSLHRLYEALIATIKVCGTILFIMVGASIFSASVSMVGLPRQVIMGVQELGLHPLVIILFVNIMYLILGCFFDFFSMLLMTLPFVYPLMMSIGADPYWLAAVIAINGECGLLTPPVGMNLYVLKGIAGEEVTLGEVAGASMPYFWLLLLTLTLVIAFPQLSTWLAHMV